MSATLTSDRVHDRDRITSGSSRLVRAELLKLRRRRGLVAATGALTVLPMLFAYGVLLVLHAGDAAAHGPAGGLENFEGSYSVLGSLTTVAAILIGATLGSGDLGAGVFRELVVTGRSRVALFAARLPAGLALLLPLVAVGFAVSAGASVALAGSLEAPSAGLLLRSGTWLVLTGTISLVLALGVASVVGSRGTSIGLLLGWQLVVAPLLVQVGALGVLRQGLATAALARLAPGDVNVPVPMSTGSAAATLTAWVIVPLAFGAWRTATREA